MEVNENLQKASCDLLCDNKGHCRSVSTSTPLIERSLADIDFPLVKNLSHSNSILNNNDSGYADSLADSTFCSPLGDVTTICNLSDFEETPITGLKCPSRSRSLVYSPDIFNPSPFSSQHNKIIRQRCDRKNLDIPVYNLDLEIDECDCDNTNLNTSSLAEQFHNMLQKFSPLVPDRLIGRKIGLENVDVLSELSFLGIPCLSAVMAYLDPADLCRMCKVSREWKSICDNDKSATKRRNEFRKQKNTGITGKENVGKKRLDFLNSRGLTGGANALLPLQSVGRLVSTPHCPPEAHKTQHDVFLEVSKTLKNDEKLQHCPKCNHAAKVLPVYERGLCQNEKCQFDYCTKCYFYYHNANPCAAPIKRTKTDKVGSKKSKKNLKRL